VSDLITQKTQLPSTVKELAPFVAVQEQLVEAARKLLNTADLNPQEYKRILIKGQQQGELVLGAQLKLKTLLEAVPKATKGIGNNQHKKKSAEIEKFTNSANPKYENYNLGSRAAIAEEIKNNLGITDHQLRQLRDLTPESVEQAIMEAKENGDIPTRSLALRIAKHDKNEANLKLPQKQNKPRTWNYIYQSRLSYADEDPDVAYLFEEINNDPELKTDEAKIEYMRNNIEFHQGAVKAFKRAITDMGY
jgi:hypothetical protein